MLQIRELTPTIFDALKAVELGCRGVQNDPYFKPDMLEWMTISDEVCLGCLATTTLMHLTGKSATDIVNCFDPESFPADKAIGERASAYGVYLPVYSFTDNDLARFEKAINYLRQADLSLLLAFYQFDTHKNAPAAIEWLNEYDSPTLGFGATKDDLIVYADFLYTELMPQMKIWFAPDK